MLKAVLVTTAVILAFSTPAISEDRFPTKRSETFEWGLGLGLLSEDEGYRNLGFETSGVPVLYLGNRYFRFFANQLDVQFVNNEQFMFGVKLEGRFDGFEADDDQFYAGMEDREGGYFAGIRGEVKTDFGNLVGEWQTDVSDESDGAYGALGSYWPIEAGRSQWVPKLALEYYDSNYTNYYFGVRENEATIDRPEYTAGSAMHVDMGVDYFLKLGKSHELIASLKYRHYGSEVRDSPLVDENGSPRINIGYMYNY